MEKGFLSIMQPQWFTSLIIALSFPNFGFTQDTLKGIELFETHADLLNNKVAYVADAIVGKHDSNYYFLDGFSVSSTGRKLVGAHYFWAFRYQGEAYVSLLYTCYGVKSWKPSASASPPTTYSWKWHYLKLDGIGRISYADVTPNTPNKIKISVGNYPRYFLNYIGPGFLQEAIQTNYRWFDEDYNKTRILVFDSTQNIGREGFYGTDQVFGDILFKFQYKEWLKELGTKGNHKTPSISEVKSVLEKINAKAAAAE